MPGVSLRNNKRHHRELSLALESCAGGQRSQKRPMWVGLRLLCVLLVVGSVSTPAWAGPGSKVYQEMREKELIYSDEAWQDYVTAIGERLVAQSSHAGRNYTFVVTDNPAVNAFTYGDEFIFINRGLIGLMRSEDELAAVIGHEIGHVIGKHSSKRRRNGILSEIGGWLGALATGTTAIWDLTNTLAGTVQAGYGRANELESDEYSANFLTRAGYNPHAMIEAIQTLKDNELYQKSVSSRPTVYHGLSTTHPKNDKRLHELVQQSLHLMPDLLAEPAGDFWGLMDGMVYGDEAATGLVKDGVYYNGSLRVVVTFPKDWSVNNSAAEVMSRTTDARITLQRQNPPTEEQSPEEYIKKTLRRDDVINGTAIEVNGSKAFVGEIKVAAGGTQLRKIAVVYKDTSVYVFQGEVGANGDLELFKSGFDQTLQSLRTMTPADLRAANHQSIKVVTAKPGDTYRSLAAKLSIQGDGEGILRLLNGHHPNGEPRAGDRIKLIQ